MDLDSHLLADHGFQVYSFILYPSLLTREKLVDFVASFAKNNKPLAEDLEQDVWEALGPERGEHLQIGEKVEMFRDPEWRRQNGVLE